MRLADFRLALGVEFSDEFFFCNVVVLSAIMFVWFACLVYLFIEEQMNLYLS